jgi:VWFA-related protein
LNAGLGFTHEAQPPAPSISPTPPLTFGVDVRIIRLDVSVVDAVGRPVRGLRAEDFDVTEDGRTVELSFFEAVSGGAGPENVIVRADGDSGGDLERVGGLAQSEPSPAHRIVILADPGPLSSAQLHRLREATSEFVRRHAREGDVVRIINLSTRETWEGRLPEDRERLASVGRRLSRHRNPLFVAGGDGSTIAEQIELDMEQEVEGAYTESLRRERFLSQFSRSAELLGLFDEILIQLAAVPGRKSLVLVGMGIPQLARLSDRLERTAHLARQAQAAIHYVDAFGLDGLLPESPGQGLKPIFAGVWERTGGSQDLAEATGGFVARFANVLTGALVRAANEARSYYVVGYAPPRKDDGKFRRVKVRLNVPRGHPAHGAIVRTKKGYIAGAR